MKGQNKLELNEETLIEAVQFWLDRIFLTDDQNRWIVVAVKSETYGSRFIFTLEGPAGKAAPDDS